MTLLDFPGHIAATIFTPGCDMRCPFCHNSELVTDSSDIEYYEDEVLAFLKTRVGKLNGIAITGGEPLMQEDIKEFIRKVRALGLKVKLDTNGTFPDKLSELLSEGLVDYVAMDIKNCPDKWAMTAGLTGEGARHMFGKTLRSMGIIKASGIDYEFRTTIVKGLHELSDMDGLGTMVRGAKRYFLQNFTDSGAILNGTWGAWDKDTLLAMLEVIRKYVPNAELRGVDL